MAAPDSTTPGGDDAKPLDRAKVEAWLSRFSLRQKVGIGIAFAATLGSLLAIVFSATSEPYRTVYSDLPPETTSKVVEALEAQNIPYKLEGDGAVAVPESRLYEARIFLAGQQLPSSGGVGFELFDRNEFGMTAFTQKVNFQRALENELARTIRSLETVDSARVHLVLPKERLFRDEQQPASASVVLGMRAGRRLEPSQVASVRYLVASAVEGMDPRQVNLIDANGNLLAQASATDPGSGVVDNGESLAQARSMERDLEQRITALVTPMVGASKVRAKVHVELDTTRVTETAEMYDPDKSAVRSEQRSEEKSGQTDVQAAGVPGTGSNLPAAAGGGAAGTGTGDKQGMSKRRETINYEVNKTVRQTRQAGFAVKRMSVAVLLDAVPQGQAAAAAPAAEGDEEGAKAPPKPVEVDLPRVEALVTSAVGLNAQRGDQLKVVAEPFRRPDMIAQADLPLWQQPQLVVPAMRFALLALLALLLAFFVLRPMVKVLTKPEAEVAEAALDNSRVEAVVGRTVAEIEAEASVIDVLADEYELDLERVDPLREAHARLRAEVVGLGSDDIDKTAQIISQWIRMDEDAGIEIPPAKEVA